MRLICSRWICPRWFCPRWIRPILLAAGALACHAATYYVDFAKGADANSGTEERAPWKTLEKVNAARFLPGDRILLKSGSSWQGQLSPASSGGDGAPLVIDRYGKGPRPRID